MASQNNIGLKQQILRPTATPIDTYVRPEGGSGLSQLAEGLSSLAPSLARFGNIVADERNTKEKLAGENAARDFAEAGKTYKQAIDAGLIEKHHSPFFRIGAYETFGRASANRYAADFITALSESPVAESTNPADFDKFESEHRAKWQKEQLGEKVDPYFANAFGGSADNLMAGERLNFAREAGARLVKQTGEAFHAEVFSIIQGGATQKQSADSIAEQVNLSMSRQIAAGMNKGVVNQLAAHAIAQAAKRVNDDGLPYGDALKVMDKIKLGSGSLSGTSYGSEAREQATAEIASQNQRRAATAEHDERVRKDKAVDGITAEFIQALDKSPSPNTVDVKPFLERMVREDPDKAATLIGIQKAVADREYIDVPAVEQRLYIGVHTGYTSMGRLDDALQSKQITFQTYSHLANEVQERDKSGRTASDAKVQAAMERVRKRVSTLFATEYGASTIEQRMRAENAGSEAVYNYLKSPEAQSGKISEEEWIHGEVGRQFNLKASDLDKAFLPAMPDAQFGPQRVEPTKGPAAPPETLRLIQSDFVIGKYSPKTIAALRALGIQPTKQAVSEFLTAQAQYLGANP
jgi:hypothetical protein